MPVCRLTRELFFPRPEDAESNGLLAIGGDLAPDRLLLAYASGIFPWYEEELPILWHSPNPRAALVPSELRVSRSLRAALRKPRFEIRLDTAFGAVIRACARIPRRESEGTWITAEMIEAYERLFELGYAHSAEAWSGGSLIGGLYGVSLGGCFFGESMFTTEPNASKVAFATLAQRLDAWGFDLIDCQVHTHHLERFGATDWDRARFLAALKTSLQKPTRLGHWQLDGGIRPVPIAKNSVSLPVLADPNAEQIRDWNEVLGPRWVVFQNQIDALIAPLGLEALERAQITASERVLDVGCGCGQSTLQLAERVAPGGSVTGIDVSTVMLERASERARLAGCSNALFERADAQTDSLEPGAFDLVFSRFGVMFFSDPVAAFSNLTSALRPGGRLAFVCWQELAANPWMDLPLRAIAQVAEREEPLDRFAPGPFAFADADRVHAILAAAGFEDLGMEPVEREITLGGGDVEGAVEFLLKIGPSAAALRDADAATRRRAAAAIRESITPFARSGSVRMASACWIATARKPA